jgi:hypothetical protein
VVHIQAAGCEDLPRPYARQQGAHDNIRQNRQPAKRDGEQRPDPALLTQPVRIGPDDCESQDDEAAARR